MQTALLSQQASHWGSAIPARSTRSEAASVVFVVAGDCSVRESLELLISSAGWDHETFPTADAFLSFPRPSIPSCLVLDVTRPSVNGLELQRRLADRIDLPIIFMSGRGDATLIVQAMKAGAAEFLTKPVRDEVMLAAIGSALDRSRAVRLQESEVRGLRDCYSSLSPRERQVMELVVAGLLNKQVGGELGISEITVKAHRGQVMRKMHAESLPHLVRMAARLNQQPALTWR